MLDNKLGSQRVTDNQTVYGFFCKEGREVECRAVTMQRGMRCTHTGGETTCASTMACSTTRQCALPP